MSPLIHVFSAPADKFFVNSFILESVDALVLIDTQFLVSTAKALVDEVAARRKPLAGIVITHPHPDHFNGLPDILDRFGPTPVFANRPTIEGIRATQADKRRTWTPVYGEDYPERDAAPDHEIGPDETLEIGGIMLRVLDLGAGESTDNTVVYLPAAAALIASDLVYSRCHPWLAEHRSQGWLDQLARVEALFSDVHQVFPGHGPVGGPELFHEQRAYIQAQREAVAARTRSGRLDDEALAAVRAAAQAGREGWPLEGLIDMNSAALAAELQGPGRVAAS